MRVNKLLTPAISGPGILCVWFHAAGLPHPGDRHRLRDDCWDLLPAECRELPVAMDLLSVSSFDVTVSHQLIRDLFPAKSSTATSGFETPFWTNLLHVIITGEARLLRIQICRYKLAWLFERT